MDEPGTPEYDTDTISLYSAAESPPRSAIFALESILAETIDEDGEIRYLVKWQDYPMDQ